eukprot:CAMPEP_0113882328 /NCGR_PEP_ID=MMETSP0780_2-20120614/8889_1 /TAXON_ID=652834 /ORGANISM="Palpitomonas bilix" /LENGTH=297 /DNA_ID=CAMNT_0000869321 /DNA_START=147 /DNA_END=1040 /DNA_ORIENTATION=+ /assembly_acc=CAM_ASM_000599
MRPSSQDAKEVHLAATDFPPLGAGLDDGRSFSSVAAAAATQPSGVIGADFAVQNENFPPLSSAAGASPSAPGRVPSQPAAAGSQSQGGAAPTVSVSTGGNERRDFASAAGTHTAEHGGGDTYGMLGLMKVIRMSDPDLTALSLGTDLTTLGLNLNSLDPLHTNFSSPWAANEVPPSASARMGSIPECYLRERPDLSPSQMASMKVETLMYCFFGFPRETAQLLAARELYRREWRFHKVKKHWFTRIPAQGANTTVTYVVFDAASWSQVVLPPESIGNMSSFLAGFASEEEMMLHKLK